MAAKLKSDPHLAIGHVLFMDVVGYSKLLVNEQREVVHQLNQVVRKTAQFRKSDARGKLISIPSGDGMEMSLPLASDRKSTRLNSSHRTISYAVFCLKKKNKLVKIHQADSINDIDN